MRFLHTSDWQIGMPLGQLGAQGARARAQRIESLRRVFEVAREREVEFVLVAGDAFDSNGVDRYDVAAVIEILRVAGMPVYILAGNHDHLGPSSVYSDPLWREAPDVVIFQKGEARHVRGGVLLASPSFGRSEMSDPTELLAAIESDPGEIRVGVAHGGLLLGNIPRDSKRPIALNAASRAKLDYLALGDWHSYYEHRDPGGGVAVYCGAHEQTKFGEPAAGGVCIVEIDAPGATPRVEHVRTRVLDWQELSWELSASMRTTDVRGQLDVIAQPGRTLARVEVRGFCIPDDLVELETLELVARERFYFFEMIRAGLSPLPSSRAEWLRRVPDGSLQVAAARLLDQSEQTNDPGERSAMLQALAVLAQEAAR